MKAKLLHPTVDGWPFGNAGEWNDISKTNKLYFIIEYDRLLEASTIDLKNQTVKLYSNPVKHQLTIESPKKNLTQLLVINFSLDRVATQKVALAELNSGIYLVQMITVNGKIEHTKVIK